MWRNTYPHHLQSRRRACLAPAW